MTGRVSNVQPPKHDGDKRSGGFIFILGDDDGESYFGHVTQLLDRKIEEIEVGMPCTFNPVPRDRGPQAMLIEFNNNA